MKERELPDFVDNRADYEKYIMRYWERGYQYVEELDACLAKKTKESIERFLVIYQDMDVLRYYAPAISELSYGHIFAVITADEIRETEASLFVLNGNSLRELTTVLKKVEFRLWEMEIGSQPDSEQRFYNCLVEHAISVTALAHIIYVGGLEKKNSYLVAACLYLDHNRIKEAVRLLEYAYGYYPQEIKYLEFLSVLCRKCGDETKAAKYEEKLACAKQ